MASLNPLSTPLDLRKAKHLLRRATFNYSKEQLETFVGMTATDAVNNLSISSANSLKEPFDPTSKTNGTDIDGFWTSATKPESYNIGDNAKKAYIMAWWWYNAMNQTSLKHKLSYFLYTSFTVEKNAASLSIHFFDYLNLLDFYALGNVKNLAKKITLNNSMLIYLNNTQNSKSNPNENYAREYLELFTVLKGKQIGEGNYTNYTEADVQQAAKVFSGFRTKLDRSEIDPDTNIPRGLAVLNQHDTTNKIFSSAFNNTEIVGGKNIAGMHQELDDFVEMVFAQTETAKGYCRKLYRFFVKSEWDETVENDIITPLAQQLIANNFEILPVVKTLLSSAHFYDMDDGDSSNSIIGSIVKSPLQLVSEISSMFKVSYPNPETNALRYFSSFFNNFLHNTYFKTAGMELYEPDSVAGYPAHYQEPSFDRLWFSSNTLIGRYKLIDSLIKGKNTITSGTIYANIDAVLFVKNTLVKPANPNDLINEMANLLYPESISIDRLNYFKSFLLETDFPDYYWTNAWNDYISTGNTSTVKTRLESLITAMVNAAEFQLM